jgi:energy-coupling factor transporter ATP-binding protein EcfA2
MASVCEDGRVDDDTLDDGTLNDDMLALAGGPLLASMAIRGMFGRYDYEIRVPLTEGGGQSRLLLLYGENGSGKTTLLKLLWHLLSPANNRGHRNAIGRIAFQEFRVMFSDGSALVVLKTDGLVGSFTITLRQPGQEDVVVVYEMDPETRRLSADRTDTLWGIELSSLSDRKSSGMYRELTKAREAAHLNTLAEQKLLGFIAAIGGDPILLADDRSLYTDDQDLARAREREGVRQGDRPDRSSATVVVERELRLTVNRVNEMLRSMTLQGQNLGSAGANTIYGEVLKQLSILPQKISKAESGASDELGAAEKLLTELERESPRFEEFGLTPHFDAQEFRKLLNDVPQDRRDLANEILGPYLTSLKARISALEDAESLLRTLLSILNNFLVDKQFTFTPRGGLRIITPDGESITPRALSSGERQLTMLLCTTLLARGGSRIFIIDEPELSLGVRWQREILAALLKLTEGTSLQFIVATHSVEMMTSERENLVRLVRSPDDISG